MTISKGKSNSLGLGLDPADSFGNKGVFVGSINTLPDGEPNPCSVCSIPIRVGDQIVAIENKSLIGLSFLDAISIIKGSGSQRLELFVERMIGGN